jgi:hypothetical protein
LVLWCGSFVLVTANTCTVYEGEAKARPSTIPICIATVTLTTVIELNISPPGAGTIHDTVLRDVIMAIATLVQKFRTVAFTSTIPFQVATVTFTTLIKFRCAPPNASTILYTVSSVIRIANTAHVYSVRTKAFSSAILIHIAAVASATVIKFGFASPDSSAIHHTVFGNGIVAVVTLI